MVLKYPAVLFVVAVLIVLMAIAIRRRYDNGSPYRGGRRAANSHVPKQLDGYEGVMRERKWKMTAVLVASAMAFALAVVLIARPVSHVQYTSHADRKDVMLCLDVSASLAEQNMDLIDTMKRIVSNLDGERVGVTIFNTTAIVDVPMTDDYDYVLERLDRLDDYLSMMNEAYLNPYSSMYLDFGSAMSYFEGTTVGSETRGSSLIGDGLATALYAFPHLDDEDDERTRVIILSTDNDEIRKEEPPVMELMEAAQVCADEDVKVMALFPDNITTIGEVSGASKADVSAELRAAAELTGGKYYAIGAPGSNAASDINAAINALELGKTSSDDVTVEVESDSPQAFFIAVCLLVLLVAGAKAWWKA